MKSVSTTTFPSNAARLVDLPNASVRGSWRIEGGSTTFSWVPTASPGGFGGGEAARPISNAVTNSANAHAATRKVRRADRGGRVTASRLRVAVTDDPHFRVGRDTRYRQPAEHRPHQCSRRLAQQHRRAHQDEKRAPIPATYRRRVRC